MRENNFYELFVVSNSTPLLEKNKTSEVLEEEQIGFFNIKDFMSFDETVSDIPKEFYIKSVSNGEYYKSPGIVINKNKITNVETTNAVNSSNAIYRVEGYTAKAETEYHLKVEFNNPDFLSFFGKNSFGVTYHYKTSCCGQDCSCPDGNCNELTKGMVKAINADSYNLIEAFPIATGDIDSGTYGTSNSYSDGDIISEEDLDLLIDWNNNPDNEDNLVCTGFIIETKYLSLRDYCIFNIGYTKFKEVDIKVYPVDNFLCKAKVTEIQPMVYEKGSGYDLKKLESFVLSWKNTYSTSLEGIPTESKYKIDIAKKYNVYTINYTENTPGSDSDFINDYIIYIAVEDSLNQTKLINLINKLAAL